MTSRTWQASKLQRVYFSVAPFAAGAFLIVVGLVTMSQSKGPVWPRLAFFAFAIALFAVLLRWMWWQMAWTVELTDTELRLRGPRRSWVMPLSDLTRVGRSVNQQQYFVATERERIYLSPLLRDGTRFVVELAKLRPDMAVTGS